MFTVRASNHNKMIRLIKTIKWVRTSPWLTLQLIKIKSSITMSEISITNRIKTLLAIQKEKGVQEIPGVKIEKNNKKFRKQLKTFLKE